VRKQYPLNTKQYTLKFILIALLFISCQSADRQAKAKKELELALKIQDTSLTKMQQVVDNLRSTTDSGFAIVLDASLQMQKLQFAFQKATDAKNASDEIIVTHPDGQRLYELMMKSYKLALQHTSKSADIISFNREISMGQREWLEKNFAGKTTSEAKKTLFRLQKDIAIISGIVNGVDSDKMRKLTEDSYKGL
jgi:hypothetical protein